MGVKIIAATEDTRSDWKPIRVNLGSPSAICAAEGEGWTARNVEALLGINTNPGTLWWAFWRVRFAIWWAKEKTREALQKLFAHRPV